MLRDLIDRLTTDQRRDLATRGITRNNLSQWRLGDRLPTTIHVADLADVTSVDWAALQREVTIARASDAQRPRIARALGKLLTGVVVILGCTLGAVAPPAQASGDYV